MPLQLSNNGDELPNAPACQVVPETGEGADFEDLALLASAICQTPMAFISLTDSKQQWVKPAKGKPAGHEVTGALFPAYPIHPDREIVIIEDVGKDERFSETPFINGEGKLAFYAGIPLITPDGLVLGSLCVIDKKRKRLSNEQIDALKIIAKQVVEKLELRKKAIVSEESIQDLRDANLFMQKFAAMAAHDIKNPLSSILLSAQSLKIRFEKLDDEAGKRLLDLNISSTKRLILLLDDMLAYSQRPSLLLTRKHAVKLFDLLGSVICLISVPVRFEILLPDNDAIINVSTIALEQIFTNLITNAIRYNNKQPGFIKIRFQEDNLHYHFEVEDNGRGIAEEYYHKIFDDSFTLKTTDRYNKRGSGIGLSTVKEIVKKLNGRIYVKSVINKGATFYFTINKE